MARGPDQDGENQILAEKVALHLLVEDLPSRHRIQARMRICMMLSSAFRDADTPLPGWLAAEITEWTVRVFPTFFHGIPEDQRESAMAEVLEGIVQAHEKAGVDLLPPWIIALLERWGK